MYIWGGCQIAIAMSHHIYVALATLQVWVCGFACKKVLLLLLLPAATSTAECEATVVSLTCSVLHGHALQPTLEKAFTCQLAGCGWCCYQILLPLVIKCHLNAQTTTLSHNATSSNTGEESSIARLVLSCLVLNPMLWSFLPAVAAGCSCCCCRRCRRGDSCCC
jgi:hypothetical protein